MTQPSPLQVLYRLGDTASVEKPDVPVVTGLKVLRQYRYRTGSHVLVYLHATESQLSELKGRRALLNDRLYDILEAVTLIHPETDRCSCCADHSSLLAIGDSVVMMAVREVGA